MAKPKSKQLFANDGTGWTTPPSPVKADEARAADEKIDKAARKADGPTATNEVQLSHTIVAGSNSKQ